MYERSLKHKEDEQTLIESYYKTVSKNRSMQNIPYLDLESWCCKTPLGKYENRMNEFEKEN